MNYRVLIVDDEPEIAEGIGFLISGFCPECEVVDVAYGGKDGYDKACALHPDIVLTDIRMPDCDGLEMIKQLQGAELDARYIVLSGYAEFEYAKKAITLGVEEFITKPVEEKELRSVLWQTCKAIRADRENRENVRFMKSLAKDYMLKEFLDHKETYTEEIKNHLGQIGFLMSEEWYLCLAIEAERTAGETKWTEFLNGEQSDIFPADFIRSYLAVEYSQNLIVLIGALKHKAEQETLLSAVEQLERNLRRKLECPVNIGVGTLCKRMEELPGSFEEARCALNYKILKGPDCVISYTQICDVEDNATLISQEDIKRLEDCIDRMDDEGSRAVVEDIFAQIGENGNLSLEDLQMLSLNLILSGIRKIPFVQFRLNQYLGKNIFSLDGISKFRTMEQLKNWIINTLKSMNELMLKDDLSEKKDVIQEAKDYIIKNYNKEIGLNEISERFFINPYYFSHLFKKKTGETFQNYLISLRVERAKKLLEETDLKIYEVCEKVGYTDTNHFIKVFARIVGMKPGEYKRLFPKK